MRPFNRLLELALAPSPPKRLYVGRDEVASFAEDLARTRTKEIRGPAAWIRRIERGHVRMNGIRVVVDRS